MPEFEQRLQSKQHKWWGWGCEEEDVCIRPLRRHAGRGIWRNGQVRFEIWTQPFYCLQMSSGKLHIFFKRKKPNRVIACRKTKLFISTLLDPHVFFSFQSETTVVSLQGCVKAPKLLQSSPGRVPESSAVRHSPQTSKHSRPLKITGTSVSSQKENKERWGIILNHLIVNKPPDVSSKPTEKRGQTSARSS